MRTPRPWWSYAPTAYDRRQRQTYEFRKRQGKYGHLAGLHETEQGPRGAPQHRMNNVNGGNVSFNVESTHHKFSPITSIADIASRGGHRVVDIVTRSDGGRYFADTNGRILNHQVALELTAKLRRRMVKKNITPSASQTHAMEIAETKSGVYGEVENPNLVDLSSLLEEDDDQPRDTQTPPMESEMTTYILCRHRSTGQIMWSDNGSLWKEVQYDGEEMFVIGDDETWIYIDQQGRPVEHHNDDGPYTTPDDESDWEIIANTSGIGKFMGNVFTMEFTHAGIGESELEDERFDARAPGRAIDVDELSMPTEEGDTDQSSPMVTWNGANYPLGGFTVRQMIQFSDNLHATHPHPMSEQRKYMERVVKFTGKAFLACQNKTMKNLVLHKLTVPEIESIYMSRSVPCVRQHIYNEMIEVEHAIWERIIIFMTVCTEHGRCSGPESIHKLNLAISGARRETPSVNCIYTREIPCNGTCPCVMPVGYAW